MPPNSSPWSPAACIPSIPIPELRLPTTVACNDATSPCDSIKIEGRKSERVTSGARIERSPSQAYRDMLADKWFASTWFFVLVTILSTASFSSFLIFVGLFPIWILVEVSVLLRCLDTFGTNSTATNNFIDPPLPSIESIERLLDHVLAIAKYVDYEEFVGGWFLGTRVKELTREHVRQFISFGFYHRFYNELSPEYQEAVRDHVVRTERAIGLIFPEVLPAPPSPSASAAIASPPLSARPSFSAYQPVPVSPALGPAVGPAADPAVKVLKTVGTFQEDDDAGSESGEAVYPCTQEEERAGTPVEEESMASNGGSAADGSATGGADDADADAVDAAAAVVGCGMAGWGRRRKPEVRFMSHCREPIRAILHPLILYVWGHIIGCLTCLAMRYLGFTKHFTSDGFKYWVKEPNRPSFSSTAFTMINKLSAASADARTKADRISSDGIGTRSSNNSRESTDSDSSSRGMSFGCSDGSFRSSSSSRDSSSRGSGGGSSRGSREGGGVPFPSYSGATVDYSEDEEEGVVFVHGLGIGLTPYLGFIGMMKRTYPNKKFIVAEMPHLAFRLSSASPTIDDIVAGLAEALQTQGLKRATFVGHSYGTFVLAQYVRKHFNTVAALGLMDPVCFLLCIPKTLLNMIYKTPENIMDGLRWFFCARELQVARSLSRNFDWHACMLWPEEMPRQQSVVLMGGQDQIVPSNHIRTMLTEKGVEFMYNDTYQHAQVLFSDTKQREFLTRLIAARATADK
ncbi:unnamed protein product [Closterium sp. Yama58-4]|nr:unnamed protein product [Closterium sp. Yama58-4]